MLIAVAGAPGAGKSVTAAQAYSACHLLGMDEPRYVPEYAHKYFGKGFTISDPASQLEVTRTQLKLEQDEIDTGGATIVCDSALWIGHAYMSMLPNPNQEYLDQYIEYAKRYDIIFYNPLFNQSTDQLNDFRIHDLEKSLKLDVSMRDFIKEYNVPNVVFLPPEYHMREAYIKYHLYEYIKNNKLPQ